MRYRTLSASACGVSSLALGTMTFGSETDESDSHAQLDRFVEAGGNLIDTADVYSRTESEAIIERWLRRQGAQVRDEVVISAKARHAPGTCPTTSAHRGGTWNEHSRDRCAAWGWSASTCTRFTAMTRSHRWKRR